MRADAIPVWAYFIGTILIIMAAIELGYRLGGASHRRSEDEKESPASGMAGAILGLTAFMLAFTFGMAADRYDARKALVRDDANALRLAYLRADFLPEQDRAETRNLLRRYVDARLAFVQEGAVRSGGTRKALAETDALQRRLWDIAVANGRKDLNSDVAALYIEALNDVFVTHATRVAVGLQARIPSGVWLTLYGLVVFCTLGNGYHMGVSGSRRAKASVVLAVSFAMVISVIASLDRPDGYVRVTQQALVDLRQFIAVEP
jgi:hypothetical protein